MTAKQKTPAKAPSRPGTLARQPKRRGMAALTAGDLMETNVVTVSCADPLSEVARVLVEERVSGVPVIDGTGAVKGVISLRDLIERFAGESISRRRRGPAFYHLSSKETLDEDVDAFEIPEEAEGTAADAMTPEVHSVPLDARLPRIAQTMARHGVHRLLVRDGKRFVGLVGTLELLAVLAAMDERR